MTSDRIYAWRATLSFHVVSNRVSQQSMITNLCLGVSVFPHKKMFRSQRFSSRRCETVVSIIRAISRILAVLRPKASHISFDMELDRVNTSWNSTMRIPVTQRCSETHHRHRLLIPALRPTPTSSASRTPCLNSGFSCQ